MNAQPAVAMALLLTFPASTFAQSTAAVRADRPDAVEPAPRLDLRSFKMVGDEPDRKPFLLPIATLRPHEFQQTATPCADAEAKGRSDADAKPMHKGWFWGGVGAGAAFGPMGVLTTAVAAVVRPEPKSVPQDVNAACYKQAFSNTARHENVRTALKGSLLGVAAWVLFIAISAASSD